jgi:hypothetical protein
MKAAVRKVRRNKKTGAIEARKRGRPHPDFEIGYLDESGEFHAGNPTRRRGKRGRPKGSVNVAKRGRPSMKHAVNASGLGQIEAIVRREVDLRLKVARDAAIVAISKALGG